MVIDFGDFERHNPLGFFLPPDVGEDRPRPEIKHVERGPRFCDACHEVAVAELDQRRRDRAAASAAEELDNGTTRGDRVRLWFDDNIERIMDS